MKNRRKKAYIKPEHTVYKLSEGLLQIIVASDVATENLSKENPGLDVTFGEEIPEYTPTKGREE